MVGTVIPPPAALIEISRYPERYPDLADDQRQRLVGVGQQLITLLSPLARITTRGALDNVLQNIGVLWTKIALELFEILSTQNLTELVKQASIETEALARKKADVLGEESLEQFLGAYKSLRAFTEWTLAQDRLGGVDAARARFMEPIVGPTVLRSSILLTTIIFVLAEAIPDWQIEAIPALCSAADDYMTQVEDAFESLIQTPILDEELVEYHATG